ncbi:16051_t:CDS:1, partial [Rhizophagus irregularis]
CRRTKDRPSSTRRNRSIYSIINEEIVSSARPTSNKRKLVVCNCPDCDGNLVDSRTKEVHDSRITKIRLYHPSC